MLVARVCFAFAPSARHSVSLRASLVPYRHRRGRSSSSPPPSTASPSLSSSLSSSSSSSSSLLPRFTSSFPRLLAQRGPTVQRPCDHRTAAREHGCRFNARWEETWVSSTSPWNPLIQGQGAAFRWEARFAVSARSQSSPRRSPVEFFFFLSLFLGRELPINLG